MHWGAPLPAVLRLQPAATDIYDFADGRVQVIGARVGAGAQVLDRSHARSTESGDSGADYRDIQDPSAAGSRHPLAVGGEIEATCMPRLAMIMIT